MKKHIFLCFLIISIFALAGCQPSISSAAPSSISIPSSSDAISDTPVSSSHSFDLPVYTDGERYANLLLDLNSLQDFCTGSNPKTAGMVAQDEDIYYSDGTSIYRRSSDGGLSTILPESFDIPILGVLAYEDETVYFMADTQSEISMYGPFYLYSLHIPTGQITNISEEIGYADRPVQRVLISGENLFIALYPTESNVTELLRVAADKEVVSLSKDFSDFSVCGTTVYFRQGTTVFAVPEQSARAVALFEIYGYSGFEIAEKHLYLFSNSPKSSSCSIIDLETFALVKKIEHAESSEMQYASGHLVGLEYVYEEMSGTVPAFIALSMSIYSHAGQEVAAYPAIQLDAPLTKFGYAITNSHWYYFDGKTMQAHAIK